MREKDGSFLLIRPNHAKVQKVVQTGFYERLLCSGCERHLNENFENDVHQLWDSGVINPNLVDFGEELLVQGSYSSLRLYFLSILWRLSVSRLPMFAGFSLEHSLQELLRRAILSLDPLDPFWVPFIIVSVEYDGGWTGEFSMPGPVESTVGGARSIRLIIGGLMIFFVVELTREVNEAAKAILRPDGILRIKRYHVNDLAGLAEVSEFVRNSLNEFDKKIAEKKAES